MKEKNKENCDSHFGFACINGKCQLKTLVKYFNVIIEFRVLQLGIMSMLPW